jgi:hypothetical protein
VKAEEGIRIFLSPIQETESVKKTPERPGNNPPVRVQPCRNCRQLEHSTCPSKGGTRKSGFQTFYYHYDEKLLRTIKEIPLQGEMGEKSHSVGEIPLSWLPRLD